MIKKATLLLFMTMLIVPAPSRAAADDRAALTKNGRSLANAVVKVFVTTNQMDYYRPWQSKGTQASAGSGAIIEGRRILTNAHVVADQTFIQVKKDADPKKYTAKLIAIGYDCDLALLEVEDPHFFDNVEPLKFGGLPEQQDNVIVIGYPEGGDKISITEGVVSRIEVTNYAQSSRQLLTVQIDAAINPGNSGGPVIQNGKIVGIAMQVLQMGQNIGYMIPTLIIDHFLQDLKDGQYEGFPILGIDFNNTENMTLREYYGIDKIKGGVLVSKVVPFSPAVGKIQPGDIILEINGILIGEDGTFPFQNDQRLSLTHIVTQEHIGEDIELKIMRDKKVIKEKVRLKPFVTLVPHPHYFEKPPYYIFGGMVFTVLSTDLTFSWGNRWWEKAPLDLVYYSIGAGRFNKEAREEIVVLLNVLPDDVNVGYHGLGNEVVTHVNGEEIKSFKDFVLTIDNLRGKEPYTIIETEQQYRIILDNSNIEKTDQEILRRNSIPYQYSDDVAQWLQKDR